MSPSCPAVTGACALTSSRTSPTLLIRSSPCHSPLAIVTPRASHPLPAPRRVSHASPHPRQHWPPPLPPPSVNQPPLFSSVRQISPGRRPSPWVGPSANFSDFVWPNLFSENLNFLRDTISSCLEIFTRF